MAQSIPPQSLETEDLMFQNPVNGEVVGTGVKRPNAEQWAWGEENMIKVKKVKFNPIALERINQARERQGQRRLTPVDVELVNIGDEAVGAKAPSTETSAPTAVSSLPTYVDNSTLSYFPPIRSQGSLNSCAQFSAVYYTLTHMTAMARGWDAKLGGDAYRFSPKWTYNMLNGGANAGTWHYDAYAIAQKHGIATWAEFPYDSNYRAWCLNPAAWRNAVGTRADKTGKVLDVDTSTGLGQLKQLLLNGYVLNFATYISSWQWKAIANDPATPADDAFAGKQAVTMVNGTSGGHAMTIVGYNDDIWVDINGDGQVASEEKGALRIANSWGTSWMEGGYCWVTYQSLRTRNPVSSSEGLFWYDEATWVTARTAYTPKLLGEFTLNHAKRSQIVMSLGISDTSATIPSVTWTPNRILSYAGGAYDFNGTTLVYDGVFYLDFTELVPNTSGAKRYYLGMRDSTAGDLSTLKFFKLIDLVNGKEIGCPTVPMVADATIKYAFIDYDIGTGTIAPVASFAASATSGDIPFTVVVDGSGSTDADGTIVSYAWNFGDGSTGTGPLCQHTYYQAGSFQITLTVTDNTGATSAASVSITVIDPNVLNAPSNLAASVSGKTVTLRWTDQSGNETGFRLERAVKTGKSYGSYTPIGTVGADVSAFTESVLSGSYLYRVQAFNALNGLVSDYSNQVSVRVK